MLYICCIGGNPGDAFKWVISWTVSCGTKLDFKYLMSMGAVREESKQMSIKLLADRSGPLFSHSASCENLYR